MPEDAADAVNRARRFLSDGGAAAAVQALSGHMSDLREDAAAWSVLGAAYFELEQWQEAEEAARQTLRLEPDSARHWSNLGTILRKQGQYDEAEEAQQRALCLDRSYRRAEMELAKIEDERLAASEDDGWKVRVADGGFVGPLSEAELAELVTLGDIEPQWNARRGTGPVTSVREAVGAEVCDESLRARAAAIPAERDLEAQEDTGRGSPSEAVLVGSKVLVGALVAAVLILGASLTWVLVGASETSVRSEALDTIGDLQTAVEVGVNYRDYNNYVIEAKRELRRLQSEVPPGALWWAEISRAMSDYEFAGDAWDWKFAGDGVRNFVYEGSPEFQLAVMKYGRDQLHDSLMRSEPHAGYPEGGIPPMPARWMLYIDGIVQTAWASASQHVENASRSAK